MVLVFGNNCVGLCYGVLTVMVLMRVVVVGMLILMVDVVVA